MGDLMQPFKRLHETFGGSDPFSMAFNEMDKVMQ